MELSRRNVAKGAAWAMPSIAIASAAPAVAGSPTPPEPGLQGWVFWDKDCNGTVPPRVEISPDAPTGPDAGLFPTGKYGFYVFNATAAQVSNACMTFSYPSTLGTLTWAAYPDNGKWSVPAPTTPARAGVTTYQTCYSGTWKDFAASGSTSAYTSVTSYPHFYANNARACTTSPIQVDILRTVTVNGTVIPLTRTITF